MAKQTINIGASPNDGTGTPLRTSFDYCNLNFTELYTATGPSGNNIVVPGNATITGDLTVATNKLKVTGGNVGIGTATPTNYANYTTLTINGTNGGDIDLTDGGTVRAQLFSESTGLTLSAVGGLIKFGAGTGGTEKMRLDASGNLGLGIATSAWQSGLNAIQFAANGVLYANGTSGSFFGTNFFTDSTGANKYLLSSQFANAYAQLSGAHIWYNAPDSGVSGAGTTATFTQAMTLDASGNLFIKKTASALGTVGIENSAGGYVQATVTSDASLFCNRLATDGKTVQFYRQTLEVGNISVTTTGATFNSTSDYRLKESVSPLTGGLSRVNALKPSVYKWKSNGSNGEGFLAHELAEVVPAAVNGEKDDANEDGTIKAQSIDMSRIVPILVAAIQELTAEVNALKNA
jgi:hypothetical protein